ncbi:cation:proton antiporter [Nocardioides rotundus]|uniref:cation:proton antiporter domain-containing protein n=1 Tax=Nocardioides rotundus TaxID=1774216 RepID=UPI001CBD904D|nr:cation:proton antiporter [Nocardioides rotundus]UAL28533.1 cation:proton antiporter [Nocardioides rotundus]
MTLDVLLIATGALGVLVAALSARIRRLPVSEPLLALVVGVLVGPEVLRALPFPPITTEHASVHDATRILLVISVMGVALRYPFGSVRAQLRPVSILLLMAMPAMALISTGLTAGILGVTLGAALLLGTAICPTDPVLASSVVTGKPAEEDLPARDRQILSLESGANDGLALLFVLAAVAFAGPMSAGRAAADALWQVLGAVALGVLAGWLGGRALRAGEAHGATAHGPMLLFTVLLALLVLGLSGVLHLDGVLAAFVAGLAFNLTSTGAERTAEVEIDEAANRFAVLPMFVLLGATLPWTVWGELGWTAIALALAVLLLRRLPVLLLLKRPLNLGWPDALYLGWFGPVGVSAVFYLTLEAEELGLPETVMGAGIMVVVVSTVAHGVTSSAGRLLYRRLTGETPTGQPVLEG